MKKFIALILGVIISVSLVACTANSTENATEKEDKTITIKSLNGKGEMVDIKVPFKPERVAILNLAVLDMLDVWGIGDTVVGMPKSSDIEYLEKYNSNENIKNLGTLKEVDMEALIQTQPEIIFISARLSEQYDDLSKIAPVVYIDTGHDVGYLKTTKENAKTVASIFGLNNEYEEKFVDFEKRIENLSKKAKEKSAVVGIVTNSSFNTLGNGTRCSLIGNEIGFNNLTKDVNSTHGNESSFELLVKLNPEYIFVLDRDSARNAQGAQLASQVMDNELVQRTDAYKNGNIIYLTPTVWYLVEGGITSTDIMISDIEKALSKQ